MEETFQSSIMTKRPVRIGAWVLASALLCAALILALIAIIGVNGNLREVTCIGSALFTRSQSADEEGYDEDSTVCRVEYTAPLPSDSSKTCVYAVTYPYETWAELPDEHTLTGYIYSASDGSYAVSDRPNAPLEEIIPIIKENRIDEQSDRPGAALALLLAGLGLIVMAAFGNRFSTYETVWFLSILTLAAIVSVLFPENSCNGVSGILIMALYLADTFLNILCELLISKQSKWNFIVSVFVEIAEILICIVLAYRFATMVTTLFFWLPIDIISFINWNRHPDRQDEDLTVVRTLRGWQEVLVIAGIVLWTVGIGYLLTRIDLGTDLFGGDRTIQTVVCYLDACASAVGVANGLFILFRFREQWFAWYLNAALEAAINILSGQFVLLVLKIGYFTNTTYGYIRWTRYIRAHDAVGCENPTPAPIDPPVTIG